MRAAIMQPTYLPWLGYLDLIDQVDTFVFLDDVQFEKQSWQQRNRIRTAAGLEWITVPALIKGRFGQEIRDVEMSGKDFVAKHTRKLTFAYGKAGFFGDYCEELSAILEECAASGKLCDLCITLVTWLCDKLGIDGRTVRSSRLDVSGKRSERLVNILQKAGATRYLSPIGSPDYLLEDRQIFSDHGISVEFQNYEHPVYQQVYQPFVPHASTVDLLFNEGPCSLDILRSGRRPSLALEEALA